jgi:MFS transporter, PAT family, beta-lactamase induction signal transducer AmpG
MTDAAVARERSWIETFLAFFERRLIAVLFLGFASGLPLALTGATLQARLTEAGADLTTIGFFALVAVAYSLKFLWSPMIDRSMPPGPFQKLGHRRGWTLLFQLLLIAAISIYGFINPAVSPITTAAVAVVVAFLSASQDIVIDAYRIEVLDDDQQGAGAAMVQYGYRFGMLASGAGALFVAEYAYRYFAEANVAAVWGAANLAEMDKAGSMALLSQSISGLIDAVHQSWIVTFLAMAALMIVGVVTTFFVREPPNRRPPAPAIEGEAGFALRLVAIVSMTAVAIVAFLMVKKGLSYLDWPTWAINAVATLLAAAVPVAIVMSLPKPRVGGNRQYEAIHIWLENAVVKPFREVAKRDGWQMILLFIVLFKVGDAVLGSMATTFYLNIGFTKPEIAEISKIFGLVATLLGVWVGSLLVTKWGMGKSLLLTGVLQLLSNLMFSWQAHVGHDIQWLYATIAIENFTGGMGSAAFVAYISRLCNLQFTATQYALFSSLAVVGRTVIASPMGGIAETIGWVDYFLLSTVMAVPGMLLLIYMLRRHPVTIETPAANIADD